MTRQEFNKLNVYDKVKLIMDQPMSEMECRDQALSIMESYYQDFGFDDMENQIYLMAKAYDYIAEEAGTDYGGVEMQNLIKEQAEALRYIERDIRKLSNEYRKKMEEHLQYFNSDIANLQDTQNNMSDEDLDTDMENPELNESIEKIKSTFKRFL
jgi:gas vesicle protein